MPLNDRSRLRLMGVHADLVKVIERAYEMSTNPFVVTEGLRTLERQRLLVAKGASQTLDSRHLTGHAVDLAVVIDREARWDWPLYRKLGDTVKAAAKELSIPIVWGGDWKGFPDGPHFELDRKAYPAG